MYLFFLFVLTPRSEGWYILPWRHLVRTSNTFKNVQQLYQEICSRSYPPRGHRKEKKYAPPSHPRFENLILLLFTVKSMIPHPLSFLPSAYMLLSASILPSTVHFLIIESGGPCRSGEFCSCSTISNMKQAHDLVVTMVIFLRMCVSCKYVDICNCENQETRHQFRARS